MNYLLSFSPWIIYAAVSSVGDWRTAVIAAAVAQALLAIRLLSRHDLDLLSTGTSSSSPR